APLATVNTMNAEVIIRRNVHFEIGFEIDVGGVGFEAEPAPAVFGGLRAASAGPHDAFATIIFLTTRAVVKFAAEPLEFLRERGVHHVAGQSERRRGQV